MPLLQRLARNRSGKVQRQWRLDRDRAPVRHDRRALGWSRFAGRAAAQGEACCRHHVHRRWHGRGWFVRGVLVKRFIVVAVLALAACGQPQQRETNEAYPVVNAPNYDARIGPNSAAGISAALPMDVDAVAAAAPNYIGAEVDDQVEGDPFKAITLSAGDEEVFRINPTADRQHIHSIVTRSTQARSPAGEIVTQSKFAVAPP